MNIIEKKLSEIRMYDKNPRKNDQAVKYVAESIREFGFKIPIVIDKDGTIVCGHTRYKAAKKLNLETVPCIVADDLSEKQIKAFRLADNKVSEKAEWDFDLLGDELDDILGIDMEAFGFDFEIEEEEPEATEDDYEVELPEEPKAKLGDVYRLGNHRLMCGDSTSIDDVEKLMNGKKATLGHNDPPYGMKKENEGVLNDNLNYDDLLKFNKEWIENQFKYLEDNGSFYCWGTDEPLMDIYSEILKPMIKKQKATFRNLITWNKGSGQGQNSDSFRSYAIADEKCLFVMCGVQGFSNNTEDYFEGFETIRAYLESEAKRVGLDAKKLKEICGVGMYSHWFTKAQWVMIPEEHYRKLQEFYKCEAFKKDCEAFKKDYESIKKDWYKTRAYFDNTHDNMNNVWNIKRTSQQERENTGGHATPKPIELCSRVIKSSSREEDIVLDVFGGSGSTLIACEQLNRNCFMMELDPKYVDVIIDRWEQFTGQKAVLLNE